MELKINKFLAKTILYLTFIFQKNKFLLVCKGYYLITSAIGKLTIELKNIFVISPQSPLGIAFKGYSKDETVSFNNTIYKILSIV